MAALKRESTGFSGWSSDSASKGFERLLDYNEHNGLNPPAFGGPSSVKQKTHFEESTSGARAASSPSLYQKGPLLGLAAMVLSICCIFATLGILVASDRKPTRTWKWQPTVYLAIATAISNACILFAFTKAVPASWWYKAYRGSTIRELHKHWQTGTNVFRAISERQHFSVLRLACVLSVLAVADGPLLQRASSVASVSGNGFLPLTIPISPEVPLGFGGIATSRFDGSTTTRDSDNSILTGRSWMYKEPIKIANVSCPGTCQATVAAPAVVSNCTIDSTSVVDLLHLKPSAGWGTIYGTNSNPAFYSTVQSDFSQENKIAEAYMTVIRMNHTFSNGSGQLIRKSCYLSPATGLYNVTIRNDELSFTTSPADVYNVELANNTDHTNFTQRWDNATIGNWLQKFVGANVSANASFFYMEADKQWVPDVGSINLFALSYQKNDANTDSSVRAFNNGWEFSDPTEDIMEQINNLLFRAGVAAAALTNTSSLIDPGLVINQVVNAQIERTEPSYTSDLRWWVGAATLQIVAIMAILPAYYGYWRVGLPATLSPVEVAKFFDAPILRDTSSGKGVEAVIHELGKSEVRLVVANNGRDYRIVRRGEGLDPS